MDLLSSRLLAPRNLLILRWSEMPKKGQKNKFVIQFSFSFSRFIRPNWFGVVKFTFKSLC